MEHMVLDTYVSEEQSIRETTHPRITYDELTEVFIVDLGRSAWCEVYGRNRFSRALDIAEKCYCDTNENYPDEES
jgi:hypothetical protein